MLGTTCTTVRAMGVRGELVHRTTPGHERRRWEISRESAEAWLAEHGRIDDRRHAGRLRSTQSVELSSQLVSTVRENQHLRAERDRLLDENAALRVIALQLRARNEATALAEAQQAEAVRHLLEAAQAQARATDALRHGLSAQDDALGEFLIPGSPQ
jgi:regulator of replication initiation timing